MAQCRVYESNQIWLAQTAVHQARLATIFIKTMNEFIKTSLGRLRAIGWVEGVSFLLILGVTMPLKYWANWPGPNKVVGMVHGVLFVAYVWAVVQVAVELRWGWQKTALALVASIMPFGTFWADAKLFKTATAQP